MAVALNCDSYNKAINYSVNEQKDAFETDAIEAVRSLVGRKQPIEKGDVVGTVAQKKAQAELHDMLLKYVMEIGGKASFIDINPWDITRNIEAELFDKHMVPISGTTIFQSLKRPQAVLQTVKNIIARTKKLDSVKDISKFMKSILLPGNFARSNDPTGQLNKLDISAKALPDNIRQSIKQFEDMYDSMDKASQNYLYNLVQHNALTLNNMGLDGITVELKDKWRTKVKIVGEHMKGGINGEKYYTIREFSGKESDVKAVDIVQTDEVVNQLMIDKYKNELFNELADGQTRYLKIKTIPLRGTQERKTWERTNKEHSKKITETLSLFEKGYVVKDVFKVSGKLYDYNYIMIKSDEMIPGEEYSVYLLSRQNRTASENMEWEHLIHEGYSEEMLADINFAENRFTDGFYKSENQELKTSSDGKLQISVWDNFERMSDKNQPLEEAMRGNIKRDKSTPGSRYQNVFQQLQDFRILHSKVAKRMSEIINSNLTERRNVDKHQENVFKRRKVSKESADAMRELVLAVGGTRSYIWKGNDGTIWTPDSRFEIQNENSSPRMWAGEVINDMLAQELETLTIKSQDANLTEEELKVVNEQVEHFKNMIYGQQNPQETDVKKVKMIKDSFQTSTTKHRALWTDASLRRKDGMVYKDYLERTFGNLHRNKLVTDLIETVTKLMEQVPEEQKDAFLSGKGKHRIMVDWAVQRAKIILGDVDTESAMSYTKTAEWLNSIPFAGNNHDAESVRKLTLTVNGIMTARYLGSSGAVGNLTQSVNDYIRFGGTIFKKAWSKLNDKMWDDIINNTGALNIVSVVNDIMQKQGSKPLSAGDFMFIPGSEELFGVPVPGKAFFDWAKILKLSRADFSTYSNKDFDQLIMRMIQGEMVNSTARADVEYIQRLLVNLNPQERTELIREKKGQLHDVMTMPQLEDNAENRKLIEQRLQLLFGRMADDMLRSMVSWKLSFFFNIDALEKWLTFTGTEETLRKLTAIMALLTADMTGQLGGNVYDEKGRELKYYTPHAVKIARDAVYATQFGMSQIYLPEIWEGIPRMLFQYKAYPMFQMYHDFNLVTAFMKGNENPGDFISRLFNAIKGKTIRIVEKVKTNEDINVNLRDRTRDMEAEMMLRFMATRMMASFFASFIGLIPFLGQILRRSMFGMPFHAIKSAENPMFGIPIKILVWASVMAMYGDDDDDDRLSELGRQLMFLTTPVLLMTLARDLYSLFESVDGLVD